MTPVQSSPVALLDQLDELRAKATAGPWAQNPADSWYVVGQYVADGEEGPEYLDVADCHKWPAGYPTDPDANAALIVAAVNAVGPLADAVRAVLALADQWEKGATRWEHPLPVPTEVNAIRTAVTAALSVTP